jgi:hypothetical protein
LLYPLSYEGGARLDPRRNRTRLPILAGGWSVLLAGLYLRRTDADIGWILVLVYPRGEKPVPPVIVPPPKLEPLSPVPPSPLAAPPTPRRRELVVFVGRAVLRSASTTGWPAVRPEVTWVVSVPAYPVLTSARVATPFLSVKAMAWPLARGVSAELGTVSTLLTVPISRATSAREPDARAGSASGTRTTTGYVGLLVVVAPCPVPLPVFVVDVDGDVDVDGRRLMEVTEPGAALVAPCGVTFAFWPTRTVPIEASGTSTVTSTAPAPTMTTLLPWLVAPFTRPTEPTVPLIEDFRVAEARSVCALLSAASAVVTAAWSVTAREALD